MIKHIYTFKPKMGSSTLQDYSACKQGTDLEIILAMGSIPAWSTSWDTAWFLWTTHAHTNG